MHFSRNIESSNTNVILFMIAKKPTDDSEENVLLFLFLILHVTRVVYTSLSNSSCRILPQQNSELSTVRKKSHKHYEIPPQVQNSATSSASSQLIPIISALVRLVFLLMLVAMPMLIPVRFACLYLNSAGSSIILFKFCCDF